MEVLFSWKRGGKYGYKVSNLSPARVSIWIKSIHMMGFLFNGKARGNLKKLGNVQGGGLCMLLQIQVDSVRQEVNSMFLLN
jgi:hypothetical protein